MSRARISHHESGRAGLQPRRYKAFLIIAVSLAPRSPAPAGLRGARDQQKAGAAISAGLKPRPSGSPLRASKRAEKSGLGARAALNSESLSPVSPLPTAECLLPTASSRAFPVLSCFLNRQQDALQKKSCQETPHKVGS